MYCVVANVASDRVLRTGAKVWVLRCNGDAACPVVNGLSKGGRRVEKYTHFKRLTGFRAAWVPPMLRGRIILMWPDRSQAEAAAAALIAQWSDVRYFNRDGSKEVKKGLREEESFTRLMRGGK